MPRFLSVAQHDASTTRAIHGVLTGAAYKRLVVSGLPGIRPDGTLPDGLAAQAEQAFDNLIALIGTAGLKREDIVAVCASVIEPDARASLASLAGAKLAGFRATAAMRQVIGLTQDGSLIELDAEVVGEG